MIDECTQVRMNFARNWSRWSIKDDELYWAISWSLFNTELNEDRALIWC